MTRYHGLSKKLEENPQKLEDALKVMEILSSVEGTTAVYDESKLKSSLLPFKDWNADDTYYGDIADVFIRNSTCDGDHRVIEVRLAKTWSLYRRRNYVNTSYKQTEERKITEKERGDIMAENNTKELDFDRKHEEDLQRLRGLRLLDDDFMQKVFEDKVCTEFLLQIILNRTDLKVLRVNGQQDIKNLQGRSVRLDILAVDAENRVYNIEIQRSDKGAGVKRARYNSSLIDANVTEPGEKYENLCESYVIFITENDIMKVGLPIYHIDRTVKETGELFGDESHIIYVNSQIKDESALGKLMHDFSCTDAKDMKYKILADRVRYFKEDEKGVATMCRAMEEMRNETARETEHAKAIKVAKGMLQSGKLSYEEIAEIAELSIDEVKALDEKVIA